MTLEEGGKVGAQPDPVVKGWRSCATMVVVVDSDGGTHRFWLEV